MKKNQSLKTYNTFGFDVKAKYFNEFSSLEELQQCLSFIKENDDWLVLGGGSNVLFTKDFKGYVFKNEIKGIEIVHENNENVTIKVGAGENWHEFVQHCVNNDFGGLENLSFIPGTVGAAPIQNIGAYGVEQKDCFQKVEVYSLLSKSVEYLSKDDCKFGYRDSIFKNWGKGLYIITHVFYNLTKKSHHFNTEYGAINEVIKNSFKGEISIKNIAHAVIQIRKSKLPDPTEIGNAGSFFKNPTITIDEYNRLKTKYSELSGYRVNDISVKIPAAWLIEHCGWKGKTFENNSYGVHKNQALVLVHYGRGNGKQIKELCFNIMNDVYKTFSIQLEAEVNIL